ncbi:MAG: crosslink repair DNA glycosylase YcaQ family protein [Clostridia bacterium]|nr:crosslink repair DNA glycosylase YcaQ family protein [Clostridia bacterium]
MSSLNLTRAQARRFMLAHQNLWPPHSLTGKPGILEHVSRVGCIQFDPLDVVGRNPELVLQSRVADFVPVMLQELLYTDRRLVDGWDKMMSIYSVEDWPFFRRQREATIHDLGGPDGPISSVLPQIRRAISEQGPVSSIDLHHDERVDWPWGPARLARAALESMYWRGELVIDHRVHTRRVYDFAYRHIPEGLLSEADPNITDMQYYDWRVARRIGGIGLLWGKSSDAWLGIPGLKAGERAEALARLTSSGKVVEVSVEGVGSPLYMRRADLLLLDNVLSSPIPPPRATVLAPLDNLLWDRRLVKELFDFEYRWEVYKPVSERQYGYYVLPILYGDRFVARFEPKRDRDARSIRIMDWWWEPGVEPSLEMQASLADCFRRFLSYIGADQLVVDEKIARRADADDLSWLS